MESDLPRSRAELARPQQQILERASFSACCLLGDHSPGRAIERGGRVRLLVCVRPDHDHAYRPFDWGYLMSGCPVDTSQSGAMPRSYQVTPEILGRRRATQHPPVRPLVDRKSMSQPVASPRTYRPRRTPPPDRANFLTEKVKVAGRDFSFVRELPWCG